MSVCLCVCELATVGCSYSYREVALALTVADNTHTHIDGPWSAACSVVWKPRIMAKRLFAFFRLFLFFFTPTDLFTVRMLVFPSHPSSSRVREKRRKDQEADSISRVTSATVIVAGATVNALIGTKKANWISFNRSLPLSKCGNGCLPIRGWIFCGGGKGFHRMEDKHGLSYFEKQH